MILWHADCNLHDAYGGTETIRIVRGGLGTMRQGLHLAPASDSGAAAYRVPLDMTTHDTPASDSGAAEALANGLSLIYVQRLLTRFEP